MYAVHVVELLDQFHVVGLHELQLHLQLHHALCEIGRQDWSLVEGLGKRPRGLPPALLLFLLV